MKCNSKKVLLPLAFLMSGLVILYYGYNVASSVFTFLNIFRTVSENEICGEYRGKNLSAYKPEINPIGDHRLVLISDYSYTYEYKSHNKESILFHGTWFFEEKSGTLYLEDFCFRVHPLLYSFRSKEEKGNVSLWAYRAKWNRIKLDMYEEMTLVKVPKSSSKSNCNSSVTDR